MKQFLVWLFWWAYQSDLPGTMLVMRAIAPFIADDTLHYEGGTFAATASWIQEDIMLFFDVQALWSEENIDPKEWLDWSIDLQGRIVFHWSERPMLAQVLDYLTAVGAAFSTQRLINIWGSRTPPVLSFAEDLGLEMVEDYYHAHTGEENA